MKLSPSEALQRCLALYEQARGQGLGPELDAIPALLPALADPAIRGQMAKLYGVHAMRKRDYAAAAQYSALACDDLPDDREARTNGLVSLLQLDRLEEAATLARAGVARQPEAFAYHDVLAEALGRLGRGDEARGHGTISLTLKDRQSTAPAFDLSAVVVPPFDAARRQRNVIAFSLYGAAERYCQGAIENVVGAPYLYPGWTCRFYVDDSVPLAVRRRLAEGGAQVVMVPGWPAQDYGTFWRYLVADDPQVDRYIVRDADSVINTRERVAVDEWLDSGRHFHVMRDEVRQTELVLAGMWGGVRGALPRLHPAITAFVSDRQRLRGRTADQEFLRDVLWPTIRQSVLTHDSQFAFGDRRDFPRVGTLPPGRSIGDWVR